MNTINSLANSIAQRIEDAGKQISELLMLLNAILARMNSTSDNYRRLAVVFNAPLVWYDGIVVPQTFEEHQRSHRFFDILSKAAFILSIAYLMVGSYFSITDDPYYLIMVFGIVLLIAVLWHYVIRAVSYRIFKLKPEKSEESRIGLAEIISVGAAIAGFAGAFIFAIGRATGDDTGIFADYFVEALFASDALLLTASGIAHAVKDYYGWSEEHTYSYETDRRQLFKLREQISKLTALLSRDLKEFNQIDETNRPPVTLPAEVVQVVQNYDKQVNENSPVGNRSSQETDSEDRLLLSNEENEEEK